MTTLPATTVCIGMPVYNGARYIRQTLASLINQSFKDITILICDDGSSDETPGICREFAATDPRIHLHINEQRLGGAKNFNQVFSLSRGQYFMWAAQDDFFHPAYVHKCLAKLESHPHAVMALSEIVLVDEAGKRITSANPIDATNIGTEGMNVVQRMHEVFRRTGWWALYGLIRPEILKKTGMYRSEFGGDVILIAELLLHGEFAKVEEPLFYYRCRTKQSFTVQHNLQSIDHTQKVSPTAYTDLMRGIVRCVVEFDMDPMTKKRIIVDLVKTLMSENAGIRSNILHENMADLIALAVSSSHLHDMALRQIDALCYGVANNK